ncbi:nucleotidyltransferase domain-containing protein [Christiangramia marina]|uniref:nucleotidyltransferase domain-containing protein n=1 Tax=Christiangramia marina TaxID=409436 RepID=UPI003AA8005C
MYGLENDTIESIKEVFQKYTSVKKVILYGSRAMGTYHASSDIDLTLIGKELTLKKQLSIENDLDDLLSPYKIDLSIFHKIDNPDLIDHIQRVGVVFYEIKLK